MGTELQRGKVGEIAEGLAEPAASLVPPRSLRAVSGSLGGNPSNDWITDPEAQSVVSALVIECTRALDAMRSPAETTQTTDLPPIETIDIEEVTIP